MIPKHFVLQWHISERCNLRCQHCYQDNYKNNNELSFETLVSIFDHFKRFLSQLEELAMHKVTAHINITGGEPFVRKDFFELLEIFYAHRNLLSFGILSNGSFIDENCAKHLKQLSPRFVQISVEGNEETHDQLRGTGHFQACIGALKHLKKQQIKTLISFTAHQKNYQQFQEVAQIAHRLKVDRLWSDRLIPCGSGSDLQTLNSEQTLHFFKIMSATKQKLEKKWFNHTEVALHRALQFLVGGNAYTCSAGRSLLTIQPNGDVYPCRRMPIKVGNILESDLFEIYQQDTLLKLRDQHLISKGCEKCFYEKHCRGGLKCLSYALTNDPFQADPSCWLANHHSPHILKPE